jgi:hypothetical protein
VDRPGQGINNDDIVLEGDLDFSPGRGRHVRRDVEVVVDTDQVSRTRGEAGGQRVKGVQLPRPQSDHAERDPGGCRVDRLGGVREEEWDIANQRLTGGWPHGLILRSSGGWRAS